SNDAYKEFANADYKDYKDMAKELPPDKIAGWLTDGKTPPFRFGLYASMLGHCGKDKHAQVLHKLLKDAESPVINGVDGTLAGCIMLKPKKGWAQLRASLGAPAKEFTPRYAALRTARFFWEFRPDLVAHKDVIEAVSQLLDQPDAADLAID